MRHRVFLLFFAVFLSLGFAISYAQAEPAATAVTGKMVTSDGKLVPIQIVKEPNVVLVRTDSNTLVAQIGTGAIEQPLPASATVDPNGPSIPELLDGAEKTWSDWEKLGWLAGMLALCNLLVNLTKFGPLNSWLESTGRKWILPYVSGALGGVLGGLSAFALHASAAKSIFAGILSGLAAVGGHEAVSNLKIANRSA